MLGGQGWDHGYTLSQIMSFLWPVTHQCSSRRKKLQQKPRSLLLLQRQEKPFLPPSGSVGLLPHSHGANKCWPSLLSDLLGETQKPRYNERGRFGSYNFLRLKSWGAASHLWFPIPGYQRRVKSICTKATPVPLLQHLGSEVGNLPILKHHFPTGDSGPPCTISFSHHLSHK